MISIRAVSLVREIHNLQISGNTSLLVIEDFSNKTIDLAVFENFWRQSRFQVKGLYFALLLSTAVFLFKGFILWSGGWFSPITLTLKVLVYANRLLLHELLMACFGCSRRHVLWKKRFRSSQVQTMAAQLLEVRCRFSVLFFVLFTWNQMFNFRKDLLSFTFDFCTKFIFLGNDKFKKRPLLLQSRTCNCKHSMEQKIVLK